eukprot:403339032
MIKPSQGTQNKNTSKLSKSPRIQEPSANVISTDQQLQRSNKKKKELDARSHNPIIKEGSDSFVTDSNCSSLDQRSISRTDIDVSSIKLNNIKKPQIQKNYNLNLNTKDELSRKSLFQDKDHQLQTIQESTYQSSLIITDEERNQKSHALLINQSDTVAQQQQIPQIQVNNVQKNVNRKSPVKAKQDYTQVINAYQNGTGQKQPSVYQVYKKNQQALNQEQNTLNISPNSLKNSQLHLQDINSRNHISNHKSNILPSNPTLIGSNHNQNHSHSLNRNDSKVGNLSLLLPDIHNQSIVNGRNSNYSISYENTNPHSNSLLSGRSRSNLTKNQQQMLQNSGLSLPQNPSQFSTLNSSNLNGSQNNVQIRNYYDVLDRQRKRSMDKIQNDLQRIYKSSLKNKINLNQKDLIQHYLNANIGNNGVNHYQSLGIQGINNNSLIQSNLSNRNSHIDLNSKQNYNINIIQNSPIIINQVRSVNNSSIAKPKIKINGSPSTGNNNYSNKIMKNLDNDSRFKEVKPKVSIVNEINKI